MVTITTLEPILPLYATSNNSIDLGLKGVSLMPTEMHARNQTTRRLEKIESLTRLTGKLLKSHDWNERLAILNAEDEVKSFLALHPILSRFLERVCSEQEYVIKAIIAIGQGPIVLNLPEDNDSYFPLLQRIAQDLVPVETFYDAIGGLIGYHLAILRLIGREDLGPYAQSGAIQYSKPQHIDLRQLTPEVKKAIRRSIENMTCLAEVYVVGGAGDRLDLRDSNTREPLPAARLQFQGRTLLEGLVRDVQAREYLHYKLFHQQVTTPIAMMTSEEKNNYQHILAICRESNWFGRPSESFFLFSQPGTPVVTEEGNWSLKAPLTLMLKPGGHGMLWKLAEDRGVFDWLLRQHRTKLLVRQVNNPVACSDYGTIAFLGFGLMGEKGFGMSSCDRLVNMPEGMSALIETRSGTDFQYRMSNIEYVELAKRGIKDLPATPGSQSSAFPSNTNILFADVDTVRKTLPTCPFPGLLINMKTEVPFLDVDWSLTEVPGGRLETTMQNIADYIFDSFDHPILPEEHAKLRTFATYSTRRKTISVTKSSLQQGQNIVGTPEGCFYDVLCNYHELLQDHCHWKMPRLPKAEESVKSPPAFVVHLHPALGPIYDVIGQKIRGGSMKKGSELQLEISEVDISNLDLAGSLCVSADNVFANPDQAGLNVYSEKTGKCSLHNVMVRNKGIDFDHSEPCWKNQFRHHEVLTIILHGNGEFHAKDVVFSGQHTFEVANGEKMVARAGPSGEIILARTKIEKPSWYWSYGFDSEDRIVLSKTSS